MASEGIVFLTDSPTITGVEQYRICSPLKHMGLVRLSGRKPSVVLEEQQENFSAIVIQREFSRNFTEFENILVFGKKKNIPVVLDMDDFLFDLPMNHPARISGFYADALLPLLNTILQVDAVTVTTNVLKDVLNRINPSIFVLPNYLDTDLWRFRPVRESLLGRPIRIIFVGTPTHQADVELINEALVTIADKYGNILEFMFIGTEPPTGLNQRGNVIAQPNMTYDFRSYIDFVQSIPADIAIAPLEDSLFNRCKSAIKYFEYTALGLPGVYADLEPYQNVICDGENGFLVRTTEDWVSALGKLIEDPGLRRAMAERAQQDVRAHWLLKDHLSEWDIAYQHIGSNQEQEMVPRHDVSNFLNLIQTQQKEIKWLRAKRQYKAAKTIVRLNQEVARHNIQLDYLRRERERMSNELELTKQEAVNYALSSSWKLTRPIRNLRRKLSKS